MVRWSNEPRRTPLAEESLAASLSRLRVAYSRVIVIDDTFIRELSQYIFCRKCSNHSELWELNVRAEGN